MKFYIVTDSNETAYSYFELSEKLNISIGEVIDAVKSNTPIKHGKYKGHLIQEGFI